MRARSRARAPEGAGGRPWSRCRGCSRPFAARRGAGRRLLAALALSASFCWASSAEPSSPASPSGPPPGQPGSGQARSSPSELERLAEISRRLVELNERLKSELASSRLSSEGLAASLESSTRELEALRRELEASRLLSSGLAASAESSARESAALREALRRAEGSLSSLERSFEGYRRAAEARIRRAERGRFLLCLAAASGWILAALGLILG